MGPDEAHIIPGYVAQRVDDAVYVLFGQHPAQHPPGVLPCRKLVQVPVDRAPAGRLAILFLVEQAKSTAQVFTTEQVDQPLPRGAAQGALVRHLGQEDELVPLAGAREPVVLQGTDHLFAE